MWSSLQLSLKHHWNCKGPGLRMTYLHGIFSFNIFHISQYLIFSETIDCYVFFHEKVIFWNFFFSHTYLKNPNMNNKQDDKTKTEVQNYVCENVMKCLKLVFVKERIILFFKINLAWQKPKVYRFSHIISLTLFWFLTISVNHIPRKVETDWALSYFLV